MRVELKDRKFSRPFDLVGKKKQKGGEKEKNNKENKKISTHFNSSKNPTSVWLLVRVSCVCVCGFIHTSGGVDNPKGLLL